MTRCPEESGKTLKVAMIWFFKKVIKLKLKSTVFSSNSTSNYSRCLPLAALLLYI